MQIMRILLATIVVVNISSIIHAEKTAITSEMLDATLYSKIAQAHLPSLNMGVGENILADKKKEETNASLAFTVKPLSSGEERMFAFKLFANHEVKTKSTPVSFVDSIVWKDLELFCGATKRDQHLFGKLNKTTTTAGTVKLAQMLVSLKTDISVLKNRQAIIKRFLADAALVKKLDTSLGRIAEAEPIFYQFFKEMDTMSALMLKQYYFSGGTSNPFNRSDMALDAYWAFVKTSLGVQAGFLTGITVASFPLGLYLLTQNRDIHIPEQGIHNTRTLGALSVGHGLLCLYSLKMLYDQLKPVLIDFPNMLQQQLMSARTFLDSLKNIDGAFEKYPELREQIPSLAKIKAFIDGIGFEDTELDELLNLLETRTFKGDPSFFSRYGRVLRAFALMGDLKYEFGSALEAVGELDAYLSVTKLMQAHEGVENNIHDKIRYSFVNFVESKTPYVKLTNFWCPLINADTVVPAGFELGGVGNAGNAVLTGPNTGGKSIAIKGLLINLILAQTFGVAPAEEAVITPFAKIYTHMNVIDNPEAGESRFMAEAMRAISIFDLVKSCNDDEFSFIVVDEMFSGTEPIPGEECAFAFAEELARHKNSMLVIATHYRYLTTLPMQTQGAFKNYKVSVNKLEDGALEFPYKLATGIADTNIALDILRLKLKQRGYETAFLNNAQKRVDERRKA